VHSWIGTDNGSQCYRCGMVLDYGETDEAGVLVDSDETRRQSEAAHALAWALCSGPETARAHHYILAAHPTDEPGAYMLDCAYGDSATDGGQVPSDINPECIGA